MAVLNLAVHNSGVSLFRAFSADLRHQAKALAGTGWLMVGD